MMKALSKFFSATALALVLAGSFLALPTVSLAQPTRPVIEDVRDEPQNTTPTPQSPTGNGAADAIIQVGAATATSTFTQAQFVPLTNLPGFQNVSATDSLPNFLNQLYRLCIGAAAVIAVLQIMRAGAMHMFNKGSLSQSQNVRKLIQDSLLGLLLVLSPAIVFGIINPDILDISLNFGAIAPDPLDPLEVASSTVNIGLQAANQAMQGATGGTPATSQPATSEIVNSEYEWRFLLKNENGGLVSSIPGQTWPSRGQGYWGARYPNQTACKQVQDGFLTWLRDNRPNWNPDITICNCNEPRSQFPQCRQ